ncbi:hypothetical protein ACYF6T_21350 [Streptomyces sp. 7R007]
MRGFLGRAADWLEFGRLESEGPVCAHHGPACAMGTEPLFELYRLVIEAKRRVGVDVPPLDEHRAATLAERAQYQREFDMALAEAKARNAAIEAELGRERP